jgi:hypothetical protein
VDIFRCRTPEVAVCNPWDEKIMLAAAARRPEPRIAIDGLMF